MRNNNLEVADTNTRLNSMYRDRLVYSILILEPSRISLYPAIFACIKLTTTYLAE